jgi:DNA-binding NarL/FixJ family response regulator
MTPTRYALVVDDHPLVGQGIAEFLKTHTLLEDAHVARHAVEMHAIMAQHGTPAVVLVDFWLAGGSTADALIVQLRSHSSAMPIIAISGDDQPAIALKARSSGAQGFVHKRHPPEVFAQAVTAVLSGLSWFDNPGMHDGMAPHRTAVQVRCSELGLTHRQGQILLMLVDGKPNKQIASALTITESTVKEHISAILAKLAVTNRIQAITKLQGMQIVVD